MIAVGILTLAFIPRIFQLMKTIAPNGVDEGIHLMQGKLLNQGFSLYTQINCLQAPVAIFLYAVINGDPFLAKFLSVCASLIAISLIMVQARELSDTLGMTVTGVLLALELYFLKEARLASIDMLCSSFLVIGFFFLIRYVKRENFLNLIPAGAFMTIASLTKLFAVIPTVITTIYLIWKKRKERKEVTLYILSMIITALVFLTPLNLKATIENIFLYQTKKGWRSIIEWIIIICEYLCVNAVLIGLACVGIWVIIKNLGEDKDRIQKEIMLIWLFSLLIAIIPQIRIMGHHMVLFSPILALFAGYGTNYIISQENWSSRILGFNIDRKKLVRGLITIIILTSALNFGAFITLMILEPQPRETPKYIAAEILEAVTTRKDIVISGDPEIALLADRSIPPELVDTAENRYPPFDDEYLIQKTLEYNVTAVVIAYRLIDFVNYREFLNTQFTRDLSAWNIDSSVIEDLYKEDILIFIKSDYFNI